MAENQTFHIGLKALIKKGDQLLILKEAPYEAGKGGKWELPGGRIQAGEDMISLSEILQREIHEECGEDLEVTVGEIVNVWRRWKPNVVFLVGFECEYQSGEIIISDEHTDFAWITVSDLTNYEFADGYREVIEQFFNQ